MSDLSHDAVDDGFHEIQLSGKQLVFLFMATTVVSVVIFLCGVLVGRGVNVGRPVAAAETTASAPVAQTPTSAPGSVPPPASDPQQVAQSTPPPAVSQAAPPPSEAPAPPPDDELTYRKRLEGEGAPAEKLKPNDGKATDRAPAADSAKLTPRPTTAKSSPSAEPAPTTGVARPGTWVVQLAALRDRAAAASIVQRLSGRGYPAYIVNPSSGAPTPVYRVQVGRYDDRHEAEQVAHRLEKEEKFNTWISR